jgi:hydrogenase nickel incorporation protein HypA/HybF
MHELSIAVQIVDVAGAEAGRYAGKPIAVHLKLGALAGVVREALLSAWELARTNTLLDDAELVIEDVPARGPCPACGGERGIRSLQDVCCDGCGQPMAQLVCGRELDVVALEFES